jgi:hypothetical protein
MGNKKEDKNTKLTSTISLKTLSKLFRPDASMDAPSDQTQENKKIHWGGKTIDIQ